MMRADIAGAFCLLALLLGPAAGAAGQESGIRVDGRLTEPAWEEAVVVSDFVQGAPVEGAAAEQPTAVRILFAAAAIYVGARLTEADGDIARQLVRRDETGQADYFQVSFDPNRDRRTGYQFRVSAAGVQQDAYLFDDNQSDESWDAVFGDFDFARDRGDLLGLHPDNVFIIKMNYWLGL